MKLERKDIETMVGNIEHSTLCLVPTFEGR